MTFQVFKKLGAVLTAAAVLSTAAITVGAESYPLGDANRDGSINISDATIIQKVNVNLVEEPDNFLAVADAYDDDVIDVRDATAIQLYIVELIDALPYNPEGSDATMPTSPTATTESTAVATDPDGWEKPIYKP